VAYIYLGYMLYSLSGQLVAKKNGFLILETAGIAFKVLVSPRALQSLPQNGSQIKVFCSLFSRESAPFDLFGFLTEQELYLFERLNTVNGVGPKTAMSVLSVAPIDQLAAALMPAKLIYSLKLQALARKLPNG